MIESDDLSGEHTSGREADREENDLSDESIIGDHHSDGSKERLEIVGQLDSARVRRIHGDEEAARVVQANLAAFEHEPRCELVFGALDREYLLSDHREHLDVDAVELVETTPRARLSQTRKEFTQHLKFYKKLLELLIIFYNNKMLITL